MLYNNGAVPADPKAVMVPLLLPHVAAAGIAFSKGAGPLMMVTSAELIHPAASFTLITCRPGASAVKKLFAW